jgi:hypothetical protein
VESRTPTLAPEMAKPGYAPGFFTLYFYCSWFGEILRQKRQGSGARDQGTGIRAQGSGHRDQGSGIRAQGAMPIEGRKKPLIASKNDARKWLRMTSEGKGNPLIC